ncbi:class I SAM-dependent methyltransferase [Catenulispora pinisilvae]|uniref:class I SAM-dependent methyltransferase n=1 Tax=Catenulispora pinisilvae TaxID=2705253 RepID=UPI001891F465|nr:class I SAM-dependent methyltransferase [Catenulispora pinisilvae]
MAKPEDPSTSLTFDEAERVLWADSGAGYEAVYASLCAHTIPALLDAAAVAADVALLDVGTGTGNVARAAVARGARVSAIDAEPSMLDLARSKVPQAEFHLAAVPELPFEAGTFDAVVGNFVLDHFGRPRVAMRALGSVTKPGGRVAFTLWPAERSAGRSIFPRVAAATRGWVPRQMPDLEAADDYPRTEEGLAGLFRETGLADVTTTVIEWDHVTTADEWWISIGSGIAGSGRAYQAQTPEVRAAFHENYQRVAAELSDEDGTMRLPYQAYVAVGTVTEST